MIRHSNDNWPEDTAPSHRVRPDRDDAGDLTRSGGASIPLAVWFLGIIVVLLVLAVCGLWALYTLRGQWAIIGPTPTPIIWTPTPLPAVPASPTPPPTEDVVPTVSPGIAIGRYVRVTGTEGSGLSLREGPGANYPRKDIALDGEVFIVVVGPEVAAGSEWWRIRDPDDDERFWWGAGNYLEPIEHP